MPNRKGQFLSRQLDIIGNNFNWRRIGCFENGGREESKRLLVTASGEEVQRNQNPRDSKTGLFSMMNRRGEFLSRQLDIIGNNFNWRRIGCFENGGREKSKRL